MSTSCVTFDEIDSESCLKDKEEECLGESAVEPVADAITHVLKKSEITGDDIKIEEDFDNSSCFVDRKLGTVEIADSDGKGSVCGGLKGNDETRKCVLKIKQETDGKRETRPRRRGKGAKKFLGTNGKENIRTHMGEVQNGCGKRGEEAKRGYSRQVKEDLRFVNLEAQKKKWVEVYCGLGQIVAREYDGLVDSNSHKLIQLNFDPRHQFEKKENNTPGILGICSS